MARLSSPESVMKKLESVHGKIDELFETVEQVKALRGRISEFYDELKQEGGQPDQTFKETPQSPGNEDPDHLAQQVHQLTEEIARIQERIQSEPAQSTVDAAVYPQENPKLQNAISSLEELTERMDEASDHFNKEIAANQSMIEKEIQGISSRLNSWEKEIKPSLFGDIESLFSDESSRLENELDIRIENLNTELKTSYSDKNRAMNELIASFQHQTDELNRVHEVSGQEVQQDINALKNEFQRRLDAFESTEKTDHKIIELKNAFENRFVTLESAVKDDSKTAELEKAFRIRLGELEAALKNDHKTDELENAFQARFEALEAEVKDSPKAAELEKAFRIRLDELEAALKNDHKTDELENAILTRFETLESKIKDAPKAAELDKAFRGRLDELEAALKNDHRTDELENAFQARFETLETEIKDAPKAAELEKAFQSRIDELEAAFKNDHKTEELEKSFNSRFETLESEIRDDRRFADLEASLRSRLDEVKSSIDKTNIDAVEKIAELENDFQARLCLLESAPPDDEKISGLQKMIVARLDNLQKTMESSNKDTRTKFTNLESALQVRLNEQETKIESAEQKSLKIEHQAENKQAELARQNKQFQKDLLNKVALSLAEKIKRMESDFQSIAKQTFISLTARQTDSRLKYDEELSRLKKQVDDYIENPENSRIQINKQHEALKQALIKISERQNKLIIAVNSQEKRLAAIESRLKLGTKPSA